jgi:hypothetical protein
MVNATDIRSAIGDYLEGKYSLDAFENWMIANTRNIHIWGDSESKYLTYSVDLQIAEYLVSEDEKITEKYIQSELRALANTYLQMPNMLIVSGTSTNSSEPLGLKIRPVGTLFSTACELPILR